MASTFPSKFSLPRPWQPFSLRWQAYNSPNDLEEQPSNETPYLLAWSRWRKGRFSTVIIIIPLLLIPATLSLATRIYILHPKHHNVIPLHPNPDLQLQSSHPPTPHLPSTRWSPTILTTCTPGLTQPYYAPCIALRTPGAIKGEELVYPDF